ncbi:FtsK/SpoIIIE domain-containing protein [Kineococcus sp. SYSU DK005]|uniref:FtsK/SpoIIIE domain-containing protein n=1 Tax=Kineococcus sp. SYSU DK005 TaxID=3383126 RepID=UPI003D7C42CA
MAHSLSAALVTAPPRPTSPALAGEAGASTARTAPAMVTRVAGLEPLPPSWPVWALSLAAGGVGCYAGAPLVHLDALGVPGGVALEAAALLSAIAGVRAQRRAWLTDQLTEALTPLLGLREPSREHVKASRWRGHWIGAPERVRLSYHRGSVNTDHPRWSQDVLATVQRLLGEEYAIRRHDARRGVLKLRRVLESAESTAAKTPAVERATRIAREMLGATATLVPTFDDELDEDGQLQLRAVTVKHQAGTRIERPAQRARIERTFSAMLPGRWRALWQLEEDTVRFEIRPTLPTRIEHPAPPQRDGLDVLRDYDKVAIELAVDEDGHLSTWQPAIDPHLMVVGATGTGKTVLLHGVLTEITAWGWPVFVNDAKGVEFLGFREWPNVRAVATTVGEQVAVIHTVWQIMEDRYAAIVEGRAHESDFEPVVLFLDEFRDFYGNLTDWYARVRVTGKGGDPSRAPVLEKVKSIARKGRTARTHLVLGTQRPDADFLSGEALAIDTPIPTPQGWTTMGQIQVGDHVLGEDGRAVRVSATTDVAHGRPCYRVSFSDGSSIVADEEHLWAARTAAQRAGDAVAATSLTRAQRWPAHAELAAQLATLVEDERVVSVSEFERELGRGRLTLLRLGINDGRWQLASVGYREGGAGRFGSRTYRRRDLIAVLRQELASPAPSWREAAARIVTTGQMARTVRGHKNGATWSIGVAAPLVLPEVDLPIDPWLLGYWLGDGHKAAATIATADEEVLERIRALGYRVRHYARFNYGISTGERGGGPVRHTLVGALRELDLLHNKHVPPVYLRASARQRAELLAGLLDADGTCAVRGSGEVLSGQVTFTNCDRRLIEAVAELAASLGFIPTVRQARGAGIEEYVTSVAHGCTLRPVWVVSFTPDQQVFGIGRKQKVLEPALAHTRRATTRQRYVIAIEPVPSVPVRCITVDSPSHLYLAGRSFIPTHNCRDNFRARVSLGRLSPQGSMMMWDSPSAAVSVPKGIRGRGITLDQGDRPREIQTFWTPDPRKVRAEHTGDLAILRSLLPTQRRHERLVIIPPHVEDTSDLDEPRYGQWAGAFLQTSSTGGPASTDHLRHLARIVPLALHPERAPRSTLAPALLLGAGHDVEAHEPDEPDDATCSTRTADDFDAEGAVIVEQVPAGSRFVSLEHRNTTEPRSRNTTSDDPEASYARDVALSYATGHDSDYDSEHDAEQDQDDELDRFAGYGDPEDLTVDELEAGMLVLLDQDTDHWAVLEEDPAPDLDDDDTRCLDWRDDNDGAGSLTVDASAMVTARHPLDEAPEQDEREDTTPASPRRAGGSSGARSTGTPRRRGSRAARPAPERPPLHVVR